MKSFEKHTNPNSNSFRSKENCSNKRLLAVGNMPEPEPELEPELEPAVSSNDNGGGCLGIGVGNVLDESGFLQINHDATTSTDQIEDCIKKEKTTSKYMRYCDFFLESYAKYIKAFSSVENTTDRKGVCANEATKEKALGQLLYSIALRPSEKGFYQQDIDDELAFRYADYSIIAYHASSASVAVSERMGKGHGSFMYDRCDSTITDMVKKCLGSKYMKCGPMDPYYELLYKLDGLSVDECGKVSIQKTSPNPSPSSKRKTSDRLFDEAVNICETKNSHPDSNLNPNLDPNAKRLNNNNSNGSSSNGNYNKNTIQNHNACSVDEYHNQNNIVGTGSELYNNNYSSSSTITCTTNSTASTATQPSAPTSATNDFMSARDKLIINNNKKNKKSTTHCNKTTQNSFPTHNNYNNNLRSTSANTRSKALGARRNANSGNKKFISPILGNANNSNSSTNTVTASNSENDQVDPRLKNLDPKLIELISSEIMDNGPKISWDDIAGLQFAKKTIMEIVVWPMLRPDIFKGLRGPPKGLLLFGPPGTGKTLIGKCIASQSQAVFFSISASSLTSKWIGEGEKLVRTLFAVARVHQPAVIFIDEIDSLLSARTDGEHESSRRIKTEFLVQLDGAGTGSSEDRILVVGATNRPHEIDEAARRRLVKRLYIPLPNEEARKTIINNLLNNFSTSISDEEIEKIVQLTKGYSGSDMNGLCKEASLGPIRDVFENQSDATQIKNIDAHQVRPITFHDFEPALQQVRPSVSSCEVERCLDWNKKFGSMAAPIES